MDQYVIVSFPDDGRVVYVDGTPYGSTNKLISLERGTHTFDLGDPHDYSPQSITRLVAGTTQDNPLQLSFAKV